MALYRSSRTVIFGFLIFGIVMAGVTCVSPPVFRVDHRGLIVHACQWTLLSDQRSTFILASVPGCHYIMSEQTYVYCLGITLFRPSHIILNSAIRTFHVLRIAVQLLSRLSVFRYCRRVGGIRSVRRIGLRSDIDEDS